MNFPRLSASSSNGHVNFFISKASLLLITQIVSQLEPDKDANEADELFISVLGVSIMYGQKILKGKEKGELNLSPYESLEVSPHPPQKGLPAPQ